jgi:Dolichyl-phosphate-mannose-protein mannosyltransferase
MVNQQSPLESRDRIVALALSALVMLAGLTRMAPNVCGVYHDDAVYVSTAQALADGDGYRLTGVPGEPLQTKYPFLYPAALAGVCAIWPTFPENILAMQIFTLLCGAAAVALGYLYLVRFGYCGRDVAAAGGVICATGSFFLYFCVQTMPGMPFALLIITSLWALERHLEHPHTSRSVQFGLGLLLALPFLCRTIGAVFVLSSIAVLFRSRRPMRWCLAGAATAALPWILWSLLGRGVWDRNPIDGYYTDYLGCWSSTGVDMIGRVFRSNALLVARGSGKFACEGLAAATKPLLDPELRTLILVSVGAIPWLMMIRPLRQGRPLPCAMAAYLLIMLLWSWPPQRFLVPILPFLTAFLMAGMSALMRRIAGGYGRRLAVATALSGLVAANLCLLARHFRITTESGYALASVTDTPVAWSSFERTLAWLKQHTRSEDVVACGLDSMASLYTGRFAFRPFVYNPGRLFYGHESPDLITVDELAAILKRSRPRYLMHTPMPGFAEEKLFDEVLEDLRRRYPNWLVVVYKDVDPRFVVFELNAQNEPRAIHPVTHNLRLRPACSRSVKQKTPRQLSPPRGVGFKWASRVWSLPTLSY